MTSICPSHRKPLTVPRGERRFHSHAHLASEALRLMTFSTWSVDHVNSSELAQAGFYYTKTLDYVQCAFCKGVVGYWEAGDKPLEEHKRHFYNCPFVRGKPTNNIPLLSEDLLLDRLYHFLEDYRTYRLEFLRPPMPKTKIQSDSIDLGMCPIKSNMMYPSQSSMECRLRSFASWPEVKDLPSPKALAEAGFFYQGVSDFVLCFSCGGGLFNWKCFDNPLEDHARYYGHCLLVRDVLVPRVPQSPIRTARSYLISNEEAELLLIHPIATRMLQMGLNKIHVMEALKNFLQEKGHLPERLTEALELVVDMEEEKRIENENINEVKYIDETGKEGKRKHWNSLRDTTIVEENGKKTLSCSFENYTNKENLVMQLKKKVCNLEMLIEKEQNRFKCRKCLIQNAEVLFLPCYHLHFCNSCVLNMSREVCPFCGIHVRGTILPILPL